MDWSRLDMRIQGLLQHYRNKEFTPAELLSYLNQLAGQVRKNNIWIHLLSDQELQPYFAALADKDPDSLPLFGVPFAIKDNIDLKSIHTTAACAEFAYLPEDSAYVVKLLIAAGAIPIGKTNMDQFATGLVGTRSPYGVCRNAFNADYISGGSSSGSAVAVALGLASFSLGTDTAGSGRVPAALNNLIGLKPTKGLLSTRGVVPACRSLDCVSVFSLTAEDAATVFNICSSYDKKDVFSRKQSFSNSARQTGNGVGKIRIGVPVNDQLEFFANDEYRLLFERSVRQWESLGASIQPIDFSPFLEAAKLLYAGPWIAERYIAIKEMLNRNSEAVHPVVRSIVEAGRQCTAEQTFSAQYHLQQLKKEADKIVSTLDFILTPTIATQFTIEQVLEDPVQKNSALGYYTNFMNLLDYAAVALPAGQTGVGVPWGITLIAPAGKDQKLLAWATSWQRATQKEVGALQTPPYAHELPVYQDTDFIDVVVCGAHLMGQPLNWQLTERGGEFIELTQTSEEYQLYALADGKRPALIRDSAAGAAIEVEVWRVPASEFGGFVAGIPAPLGIGKVELADGRYCSGFICEPSGLNTAIDITHLGSWRRYLAQRT